MDQIQSFEARLAAAIKEHSLLVDSRPVLVALSGGADSTALLAGLTALGCQCVAAHCNYHLRGEESNRDMRHAQRLCADLGVDLYVRDFDVEARRAATGESVEMACRELRYEWFADRLDRLRAQAIAVAHHREDNTETFMLNLLRGTGIAGLTGMRWRNGYVIRPLLDFSRQEIEGYLAAKGIAYVNDSTNAENTFARNKLRNIVLPMLEDLFPGAGENILATISHLSDNREFYDTCVEEKRKLYFEGNDINLSKLIAEEKCPRMLLFELARPLGFNMTQVDNMLASARRSGLSFTAGDTVLELDRGWLRQRGKIEEPRQREIEVSLSRDILSPAHVLISEHPVAAFKPERNARVAYFDEELLRRRVTLRHWMRGDRMRPYGMNGSRLVSDIFSDAKYSAEQKRHAWLMLADGEIIWIMGLRQSSAFSIVPETRRYLRLELR